MNDNQIISLTYRDLPNQFTSNLPVFFEVYHTYTTPSIEEGSIQRE